jgi:multisubunit Na+/H+ antiporter MnhB subunit
MIIISKYLTLLSSFLLASTYLRLLYPFEYLPKTAITYITIYGITGVALLLSIAPSLCFHFFCWRKFENKKKTRNEVTLLLGSVALILCSLLVAYPTFTGPNSYRSGIGFLMPLTAGFNHLLIFAVSLICLLIWNKEKPNKSE